jgi:hypothetical protein
MTGLLLADIHWLGAARLSLRIQTKSPVCTDLMARGIRAGGTDLAR